jgi:hypothetical protein
MTNKLDRVYNKLRGRKLCGLEAQCFDGVMIQEVIRHRLGSYAGDWVTRSIRRRGEPAF